MCRVISCQPDFKWIVFVFEVSDLFIKYVVYRLMYFLYEYV